MTAKTAEKRLSALRAFLATFEVKSLMSLRKEILIHDFNKRERVVLELIHQLTIDINRISVKIPSDEFAVVGIDRHHIKPILTDLEWNRVLIHNEYGYQINRAVNEWVVDLVPGYDTKKWQQLFRFNQPNFAGKCSSQTGNQNYQNGNPDKKESIQRKNNINNNINTKCSSNTCVGEEKIIDSFRSQFQKTMGVPYHVSWGKDQKLLNDLVNLYGATKVREAIPRFFKLYESSDSFLCASKMDIGVFYSVINKLMIPKRKEVFYDDNQHANQRDNIHEQANADYFRTLQGKGDSVQFTGTTQTN